MEIPLADIKATRAIVRIFKNGEDVPRASPIQQAITLACFANPVPPDPIEPFIEFGTKFSF